MSSSTRHQMRCNSAAGYGISARSTGFGVASSLRSSDTNYSRMSVYSPERYSQTSDDRGRSHQPVRSPTSYPYDQRQIYGHTPYAQQYSTEKSPAIDRCLGTGSSSPSTTQRSIDRGQSIYPPSRPPIWSPALEEPRKSTPRRATESISAARSQYEVAQRAPLMSNSYVTQGRHQVQSEQRPLVDVLRPLGLPNLGNTCYMNSVLQCVLQLGSLLQTLQRANRDHDKGRKMPVLQCLLSLSQERVHAQRRTLVASMKSMMGKRNSEFAWYEQADAHEFLRTMLLAVHEEINRNTQAASYVELKDIPHERPAETEARWLLHHKRRDDSVIYDYFGGVIKATTTCRGCRYKSLAFDPCLDLSLPFDRNVVRDENFLLGDMMEALWATEEIDRIQAWKCSECKTVRGAIRRQELLYLPKILVLHLKRFNSRGAKVEASVQFPFRLVRTEKIYRLKGVVCHSGSTTMGHYSSYVSVGGQEWHYCSDSTVTPCQPLEVLRASHSAFMLFYEEFI